MGRKDIVKAYQIFTGEDASVSFDNKSNPTDVSSLDNAGLTLQWTGTPVGEFKVFVSNDSADYQAGRPVVNWTELDFGAPIVIDGTETNHLINMNQLPFNWLAVGYESGSGTGALSVQMTAKMV